MNYLTTDFIKLHSRICQDAEDSLLTTYGGAAEQAVMNICNTTYECMMSTYGEIPAPVMVATVMIVDVMYEHRSPNSPVNMAAVDYTFDFLIKPYMILADNEDECSSNI